MDIFSKEKRSHIMRQVRSKNTTPELIVRSIAHRLGYRFRLHKIDLPGKPDLVFSKYKKVIFVHGCFWHGHNCRAGENTPKSNKSYWKEKLQRNRQRDAENIQQLKVLGWETLVIWECETKNAEKLKAIINCFLDQNCPTYKD